MNDENKKISIKDWALEDRPREKMLSKGIQALSNAELMAILIGSGNREETAVELSQRILHSVDNNLHQLGMLTTDYLINNFKGIGEAKAITILAALELGRRRKASDMLQREQFTCSRDVYEYFLSHMGHLQHEELWVLLLNQANRKIKHIRVTVGGVSSTVADVRLILKPAIENLASTIILAHNHPSGSLKPSQHDIDLTRKTKEAARLMEITLADHLIITETAYYSFADEGMM